MVKKIMKKILLAEDNEHLRELVQDYLSENGFEVDARADGLSALNCVKRFGKRKMFRYYF